MYQVGQDIRKVYVDNLGFLPKELDSNFKISHTYIWYAALLDQNDERY